MMEKSNSHTSPAQAIEGPKTFDGRSPAYFRDWGKRPGVVIGVSRRDIDNLIKGRPGPIEMTAVTGPSSAHAQEIAACVPAHQDLYAMLFVPTEQPASLLVLKHEDESKATDDGQKALQELGSKYNEATDEIIHAKNDKLVNSNTMQEDDQDFYFMKKTLARSDLETMGEMVFDRRLQDKRVQGFTALN